MRTGIDPTVDYAFKRVFATDENAPLLVHFLNAVLNPEPSKRIIRVERLTTIHDRQTADDKLIVVDLRVRDSQGRQIIIEMQVVVTQAFRERLLYYWARDYVQQLREGDDYSTLVPTILICIVHGTLFPETDRHFLNFRLRTDEGEPIFSDRIQIHTLELGKFHGAAESLATELD